MKRIFKIRNSVRQSYGSFYYIIPRTITILFINSRTSGILRIDLSYDWHKEDNT